MLWRSRLSRSGAADLLMHAVVGAGVAAVVAAGVAAGLAAGVYAGLASGELVIKAGRHSHTLHSGSCHPLRTHILALSAHSAALSSTNSNFGSLAIDS